MKSVVAAVIGANGKRRIIIDQFENLHYHVIEGEELVVIPDFNVDEPLPWAEIPLVVAIVENYLQKWHKSS